MHPHLSSPAAPVPGERAYVPPTGPVEHPSLCATPNCNNLVTDYWEETGRLCGRCAIEEDLYDRETRRLRSFPFDVPF